MNVSVAAIDLGASNGRVMVGDVGPGHLELREVARFANEPVRLADGLHWDPLHLYRQALVGMRRAVGETPNGLSSVAVDSWAVDYALMRGTSMISVPFHYRDGRTAAGVERVHARVPATRLHELNGLQFLPFTTIYQLAADPFLGDAQHILLMPDLIGFWLTERMVSERTNASTTGLLDIATRAWNTGLMSELGMPSSLFPELVDPGTTIGPVTASVGELIGSPGLPVTAVGSHDTASAVVGTPMLSDDAAYISCGTWGLVGVELDEPVVTDAARVANFTNEAGVDGKTRFLTNVMGTWLLSETLRTWAVDSSASALPDLLMAAGSVTGEVTLFDVQDPRFLPPGDMPQRIAAWCAERGARAPDGPAETIRSIVESMAQAFTDAVRSAETLSGRTLRVVHVVGGGARNSLLCQAIANRAGQPVLAGPVEATAIGNVLVQGRATGALSGDLTSLRRLVATTHDVRRYEPAARSR